jgi:hypothetical protein
MTKRATAGLGAGLVLLAGLLAGCGDDGDDNGNGNGSDGQSAEDFADQSYDEIKQAAIDAMGSLKSVHVEADITAEGQKATLDLSMSEDGNCTGNVSFGGISAEVLQADGGAWFKPSPELLTQQFGDQAPAVIEFVGDSWVADTEGQVTPSNCDLAGFIDQVTSDEEDESNTEVAGLEDLDGAEVVRIDFTNDDGDGSAYILAEGEHYIAKFEVEGDEPGTVEFSEFDEDVTTEAPAEDEIVDLADFQS